MLPPDESRSSSNSGSAPADPLAALLDAPTNGAPHEPPPPQLDPANPSPAARLLVSTVLATIEGALVRSRGEHWRIPADLRPEMIRANAHALEVYAPSLDAPWIPAAASVLLWFAAANSAGKNLEHGTNTEGRGVVDRQDSAGGSANATA
jgi:hypothetical protein